MSDLDPRLPGVERPLERPGGPAGVRLASTRVGDRRWMARALEQARLAAHRGEVPVGAVLVRDEALLAEGHNRTLSRPDPTAHAEVEVLRKGASRIGGWRLGGCTLYVTLEPCAQCSGALVLARVDRVVYGAADPKAGMAGSLGNVPQDARLNHRVELTAGVLAEASSRLLRSFFRARRLGVAALGLISACSLATTPLPPAAPPDLPPPSSERPPPEADHPPVRAPSGPPAVPPTPVPTPRPAMPPDATPAGGGGPALGARPLPARLPAQVRALWVVRTALTHPDSVRAVVRRAEAGGFNTLLVQVRGRGDAWYRSSWEPRAVQLAHLPADYDPLQLLLDEARPRGLQVHAWINVHVVASAELPPVDPFHLVRTDPEWLALPRALVGEIGQLSPRDPRYLDTLLRWTRANAAQVEGLYSSPAHPDVRRRVVAVAQELVERYPLDGIHLDYVRFPSPQFDYSAEALRSFRHWLAGESPDLTRLAAADARGVRDPLALPDAFPEHWARFREAQVTELVLDVARMVRATDPAVLLSTAVFPDPDDARASRYQAWQSWLGAGWIDVVVPMAYTASDAVFLNQVRRASAVAGPRRVWAGVGLYRNTFEGSASKGRAAFREGVGGVALFSYDWAMGAEGAASAASATSGTSAAAAARFGGGGSYLERWAREVWADR